MTTSGRVSRRAWRHHSDRGDMNIEVALLAGAVLLMLALLYTAGQIITSENAVTEAARSAARAASISRDGPAAATAAKAQAEQTLARQLHCESTQVTVDTTQFSRPLGQAATVTATVTCTVAFAAMTVPGTPGTHTMTATFTSPIDRYGQRATGPTNTGGAP